MSMTDQIFDALGNRLVSGHRPLIAEPATGNSSRFLARFGVALFWVLAIAIVSARIFAGV
jgi:hypothetical protein